MDPTTRLSKNKKKKQRQQQKKQQQQQTAENQHPSHAPDGKDRSPSNSRPGSPTSRSTNHSQSQVRNQTTPPPAMSQSPRSQPGKYHPYGMMIETETYAVNLDGEPVSEPISHTSASIDGAGTHPQSLQSAINMLASEKLQKALQDRLGRAPTIEDLPLALMGGVAAGAGIAQSDWEKAGATAQGLYPNLSNSCQYSACELTPPQPSFWQPLPISTSVWVPIRKGSCQMTKLTGPPFPTTFGRSSGMHCR